jgi:hypothetical protein
MSRYLETSVYSLEGNSIWDVALKFERLGLEQMNSNSDVIYQGQNMTDSNVKDATIFKIAFDKFFSLYKEFYIKVAKGTPAIFELDVDEQFETDVIKESEKGPIKTSINKYVDTFKSLQNSLEDNRKIIITHMGDIYAKIGRITTLVSDSNLTKYVKLDMIPMALNRLDEIGDEIGISISDEYPLKYDEIIETLKQARSNRKKLIIAEYNKEIKSKNETSSTLKLYEGSSSNILRDMLAVSYNLVQDISTKRLNLQQAMINDERLSLSIIKDYELILEYNDDLFNSTEVKKNYIETYKKVVENLIKMQPFIKGIQSGLGQDA